MCEFKSVSDQFTLLLVMSMRQRNITCLGRGTTQSFARVRDGGVTGRRAAVVSIIAHDPTEGSKWQ